MTKNEQMNILRDALNVCNLSQSQNVHEAAIRGLDALVQLAAAIQPALEPFGYFHELLDHEGKGNGIWFGCCQKSVTEQSHIEGETDKEVIELYRAPQGEKSDQALFAENMVGGSLSDAVIIAIAARIFDFKPHKHGDEVKGKYLRFAAELQQLTASGAGDLPCNYVGDWDRNEPCKRCTVCHDTKYGETSATACSTALAQLDKARRSSNGAGGRND